MQRDMFAVDYAPDAPAPIPALCHLKSAMNHIMHAAEREEMADECRDRLITTYGALHAVMRAIAEGA
jgi:hypothetical protein